MYASELFLFHGVEERIIFDWTHMVTYFSEDTGKAICVLVFPILQTEFKTFNQIVLRKERRAKTLTNTFDSGTISGKREGKYCKGLNSGELEKLSL